MFHKFLTILILAIIGLIITLTLAWPEEFSEKLLPVLMVGGVIVYLFLSWYLGYFIGSEKPSQTLLFIGLGAVIIAFLSGYFIGTK